MSMLNSIQDMAAAAKQAARNVAALSTVAKNNVLLRMADALIEQKAYIQQENEKDLAAGREKGLSSAMLDRLNLTDKVMDSMVNGLKEVVALPDPVGEISEMIKRPNGLMVGRMRIPLGVIGIGSEHAWVTDRTAMRMPDGEWGPFNRKAVRVGEEVGVYVKYRKRADSGTLDVYLNYGDITSTVSRQF